MHTNTIATRGAELRSPSEPTDFALISVWSLPSGVWDFSPGSSGRLYGKPLKRCAGSSSVTVVENKFHEFGKYLLYDKEQRLDTFNRWSSRTRLCPTVFEYLQDKINGFKDVDIFRTPATAVFQVYKSRAQTTGYFCLFDTFSCCVMVGRLPTLRA